MEQLVFDVVATAERDRDPAVALSAAAFATASAFAAACCAATTASRCNFKAGVESLLGSVILLAAFCARFGPGRPIVAVLTSELDTIVSIEYIS